MSQLRPAKGRSKSRKKPASRSRKERPNGTRKPAVRPEEDVPTAPPSVGRMERTRRLILAALRVWELKRKMTE